MKIDFCLSSFHSRGSPIILSISTLHLPLFHPHTRVYFLTLTVSGWVAIHSRLFVVEKVYNTLDYLLRCRNSHPCCPVSETMRDTLCLLEMHFQASRWDPFSLLLWASQTFLTVLPGATGSWDWIHLLNSSLGSAWFTCFLSPSWESTYSCLCNP